MATVVALILQYGNLDKTENNYYFILITEFTINH